MAKKAQRRITRNKKFAYTIIFLAAFALVFGSVLSYLGYRSYTPPPASGNNPLDSKREAERLLSTAKQYEDSLVKYPDNIYFLTQLGNTYYDLGRTYLINNDDKKMIEYFGLAIAPYGKALEIEPENVDVRVDRAVSAFWSQNYELAEGEFKKAIEINPEHVQAYYNYGIFLFYGVNRPAEAIVQWQKVLDLNPTSDPTLIAQTRSWIAQAEEAMKTPPIPNFNTNN